MNVTAKSKWKSVPLDAQLMARGFSEGLMGIEELSSYDLVQVKKKTSGPGTSNGKVTKVEGSKIISGKNVLKRPLNVEGEEIEEEPKKKKKTRQKRKPKKKVPKGIKPEQSQSKNESVINDKELPIQLPGWKDFSVPQPVLRALKELGFEEPTPIQRETMPAALNGHADIVGAAETGSGKTLAFAIPMIYGILADREKDKENSVTPVDEDNLKEQEDSNNCDDVLEESSEEEEDMEITDTVESGCVRVVNDVQFDFDVVDIVENPLISEMDQDPEKSEKKKKNQKWTKKGKLRALVLTPTRELAVQVKNHIEAIAKYTDIKAAVIVGGMAVQKQIRLLDQAPEIVVATPGRLWDLIQEGHSHLSQVKDLSYLAIDETDRMVEKGHFEELQNLLEMINEDENKKKRRQTFVFSATLSLIHELPKHLKDKKGAKQMTSEEKLKNLMEMIGVKPRPKIVDLSRKVGMTAETLTESRIHCPTNEKDIYLYYFLQQHPGRTMVFCNSIDCVRRLVNLFELMWTEPLGLHAQMHQRQRLKNLERFSANDNGLLIATDVAARGLDIPNVEHVVHYQVPRTSESYIHRSGRTARARKEGVSVVLIDASENLFYKRMCKNCNRDDDLPAFPVDSNVLNAIKMRVNTARKLDKLMLDDRKETVEKNWLQKAAEEADLVLSASSDDENEFTCSKSKLKADLKSKIKSTRAELNTLLATPMHTQSFAGKYPTMSGRLQLPTDFTHFEEKKKSAVHAISKSEAELKSMLRGNKNGSATTALVKKKKKKKKTKN